MRVAVSSQGNDIDSLVDPRFGRARWFIIVETEGGECRAQDNSANVEASGGAGVAAGTTVVSQGVEAVITGNVGPNAHKVLAAASVPIYQIGNGISVRDAIGAFERGELATVQAPTVSGHWA
jgi:predicted Fe-Mo cluster-binding NifX family protein